MSNSGWIASDDQGSSGMPGSDFAKKFAGIKRAKNGQYELHVRSVWGSNQGYLEEHGREERKFRADSLDDLLRIGIAELRGDKDFDAPGFAQAIRNAVYEAQDLESDDKSIHVILTPSDEGGYTVTSSAHPGCISEGNTLPEAIRNFSEALALWLDNATV